MEVKENSSITSMHDRWILKATTHKVISPCCVLDDARVCSLEEHAWDLEMKVWLVEDSIFTNEALIIMEIPPSGRQSKERCPILTWYSEQVKLCM